MSDSTLPDLARRAAELGLKVTTKTCGMCRGAGSWLAARTYRCGYEAGGAVVIRCGTCEKGHVPDLRPEALLMAVAVWGLGRRNEVTVGGNPDDDARAVVAVRRFGAQCTRAHASGRLFAESVSTSWSVVDDATPSGIARAALEAFIAANEEHK